MVTQRGAGRAANRNAVSAVSVFVVRESHVGRVEPRVMDVQVLVSQVEAPAELRRWITSRLTEVLGTAVASVSSIAVMMSPVSKHGSERMMRCSMVVTTLNGRRVVETRDAKLDAAVERAMRLVSLSLFAEERPAVLPIAKTAPLT